MKSLRVFVCILVLLFNFVSVNDDTTFGFENVRAQSTSANSQGSYSYYSNQTNSLLSNGNIQLESLRQETRTFQKLTQAEKQQRLAAIEGYITVITQIRTVYTNTFRDQQNQKKDAADAQLAALSAAISAGDSAYASLANKAGDSYADPIYQAVVGRTGLGGLLTQVQQIRAGDFAAGSEQANALVNASNVTQTGANSIKEANPDKCIIISTSPNIGPCVTDSVVWLIKGVFLNIAGFFLWATANLFNQSIIIGILNFKDWAPDTLYPIWIIIRQVISLIIVFVGLYLGFMYILGKEEKFEHYIPWVIIFALFVNFSYPIARTAIDVSNIVSLKIYTSSLGNEVLTNTDIFAESTAGAIIVSKLGLQGLLVSAVDTPTGQGSMLDGINTIPGALVAVIFVLYATYIFFMISLMMIFRTLALVFITIASPLLLVDSVLPILGDQAKKLRQIFFEQLAVGPVFMIMLAITIRALELLSQGPLKTTGGSNTIVQFFNVLMMTIMLHIMLTVTKKIGGEVGNYATNIMGKVGAVGLGAATGGAAFAMRTGVGRAVDKAKERGWVSEDPNSMSNKFARTLNTSSFDLRNSKVVARGAAMAGFNMGGMGTGQKGGFEADSEKRMQRIKAKSERIKVRYEEDQYERDASGNIIMESNGLPKVQEGKRKGDVNNEAMKLKERFVAKEGKSIFMTKKQREEIETSLAEEKRKDVIEKYNKLDNRNQKDLEIEKQKQALADVQKNDKEFKSPEAKAIIKVLEELNKERDEYYKQTERERSGYAKQVENALNTYKKLPQEKKQTFLANLNKDIQDEVTSKITRQERLDKVKDGRAANIEKEKTTIADSKKTDEGTAMEIERIKKEFDEKIEKQRNTTRESSLVGLDGKKIQVGASESEIRELEVLKQQQIDQALKRQADAQKEKMESSARLDQAEKKQVTSEKKVGGFSEKIENDRSFEDFELAKRARAERAKQQEAEVVRRAQAGAAQVSGQNTPPPTSQTTQRQQTSPMNQTTTSSTPSSPTNQRPLPSSPAPGTSTQQTPAPAPAPSSTTTTSTV